jgi:hypothetical protein
LRQENPYGDAEDEPGTASQTVAFNPYVETTCKITTGPSANPNHAPGREEPDAEGGVRRLRACDRRPDGVKSRRPEPADHEQHKDDPEL